MAVEVKVPAVGESVQEGMIQSWHKNSGDVVKIDDVLLDLETDKATVEVLASASGVLKIIIPAGQVVKIGAVIASIDTDAKGQTAAPIAETKTEPKVEPSAKTKESAPANNEVKNPGPAARHMLENNNLKAEDLSGSGKGGRVTKADITQHLATSQPKASTAAPAKPSPVVSLASHFGRSRESTKKPMSMIRRRIAERLLSAQQNAAILTTFNEIDMTQILELRAKYQDSFTKRHGMKLGFMGFFLKASVVALQEFEAVNAYIEGQDIVYHNYCDIGVAVSTEKGLMVPVIRDVDQMNIAQIEQAIAGFAEKARNNKITVDDLSGGTFTVSNGGVFGSLLSTPILNPPQSAILGMHKTQQRAMVMPDGSIAARPMMYLAMSYDHRIIDGKEAVAFLVRIKEILEDPARLVLGV